jgi:PKD repeat protein
VPENKIPTALFTHTEAEELLTIDFDASESDDEDGEVVSYAWDFDGDGAVDSNEGPFVTHKYEKRGEYEVRLVVTDDDGDDSEPFTATVTVEGPELQFTTTAEKYTKLTQSPPMMKLLAEEGDEVQVGDTVKVSIAIENTGEVPLEDVRLNGGIDDLEITAEKENTLEYLSAMTEAIERLDPAASDTLVFLFKARHEQEGIGIQVKSVSGLIVHESVEDERHTVDITGCPVGKVTGLGSAEDSEGCVKLTVLPAPVVVNSTGDEPLDSGLDEEDGCSTGGSIVREGQSEAECTLRAAMEFVANKTETLPMKIEFDIPGDEAVHVIELNGPALPAIDAPVSLLGSSQPGGKVEIDGGLLQGGSLTKGFDLGGAEHAVLVEGLAFYGFPGIVLAVGGQGGVVEGCYIGSDWARSYTSTDDAVIGSLRNGGVAVMVTGSGARIGGFSGEGNLIVGSSYGVFVEGADDVEIMGNEIGILESPHSENGIELSAASDVRIGNADAPNKILYNVGHGVKIDGFSEDYRIEGNTIKSNRLDGIHITQSAASASESAVGGDEAGNTIEANKGAGIRIEGPASAGDSFNPALTIQGNTIKGNEQIGIMMAGASAVLIGGPSGTPGQGLGNDIEDGVRLDSGFSVHIQGNRITRLDPASGFSSAGDVIFVKGTRNVIGGETAAEGNVIYGVPTPDQETGSSEDGDASGFGLTDEGFETLIQRNTVGVEGALYTGVVLRGAQARLVENVISGNTNIGVSVRSLADIHGNLIGTSETGNGANANGGAGIELWVGATVGGEKEDEECVAPCNVISGNAGPGVLVHPEATGARIQGNHIGVGLDGLSLVGNGESGILALANNVVIGGANDIELFECKGACNMIAANGEDGIRNFRAEEYSTLHSGGAANTMGTGEKGASGFVVEGNFIGTGLGIAGSGNAGHGIALGGLGSNHRIGGTSTGAGNLIAGNGRAGVVVMASTQSAFFKGTQWVGGKGNAIRGNRIVNNGGGAIDLYPNYVLPGGDGWTSISTEDRSYGPNAMINWPYLIESTQSFASNDILLLWKGAEGASGQFSLDVYTSAACNGAIGNAENYFVSRNLSFPVAGSAGVDTVRIQVPFIPSQPYYTATITDAQGNTSELSNCRLAGDRPAKALASLEPGVRQQVNTILLTLGAADPESAAKIAQGLDVLVLEFDKPTGEDAFENTAAMSPSGGYIVPQSVMSGYWELLEIGLPASTRYDVCLVAEGVAQPEDAVLLGRDARSAGLWRAFPTRAETVEGVAYLCADGVPLTQFAIGSGDAPALPSPELTFPASGASDVNVGVPFTWEPVAGATAYHMQVASDPYFTSLVFEQGQLTSPSATPTTLARNVQHHWRVRAYMGDEAGPWSAPRRFMSSLTMVGLDGDGTLPAEYILEQNYPNPFNPSTVIAFQLPETAPVTLSVYDVLGRPVASLVSGTLPAGRHEVSFDASRLSTGVYIYRLQAGSFVTSRQMMLVK